MTAPVMAPYETKENAHIPVLLNEVVQSLAPAPDKIYIDGTFGRGGYSRAILDACPDCTVIGIDQDPQAIAHGQNIAKEYDGHLKIVEGNFADMATLIANMGIEKVDGIALDLGVSSPQLDDAARGFSFMHDAALDMRMSQSGKTAADLVNETAEEDLANILYRYGDEHKSRHIARAIVTEREQTPITRTTQLAEIIRRVVAKTGKTDPATKSFQALRIAVNNELGALEKGLESAEKILAPTGILAVVSFHSLEDRIVKSFMRERAGALPSGSRHLPPSDLTDIPAPSFDLPRKSVIKPSAKEISQNPRSRSSRLRVAIRTDAPAWQNKGGAA